MGTFPTFTEWAATRVLTEKKKAATPDYSFDRWIKSASQLGSQVDSLVGQAKEKEKEADKDLEKKKKDKPKAPEKKPETSDKDEEPKFDKGVWGRLKKIAKERAERIERKQDGKAVNSISGSNK